jgi:hypothetical protein
MTRAGWVEVDTRGCRWRGLIGAECRGRFERALRGLIQTSRCHRFKHHGWHQIRCNARYTHHVNRSRRIHSIDLNTCILHCRRSRNILGNGQQWLRWIEENTNMLIFKNWMITAAQPKKIIRTYTFLTDDRVSSRRRCVFRERMRNGRPRNLRRDLQQFPIRIDWRRDAYDACRSRGDWRLHKTSPAIHT